MKSVLAALALSLVMGSMAMAADTADVTPLDHKMKDIDGKDVDLAQYKGKVVLIVNVASKCGHTKQYTGLEAMYQKYKDKGFVILAFPANNFGKQEPGTNQQIKEFCTAEDSKYHITFPLFSKISVKGEDQDPLYKELTTYSMGKATGDVAWNFEKFLVGKDGKVSGRFRSAVTPESKDLVAAVEKELGK